MQLPTQLTHAGATPSATTPKTTSVSSSNGTITANDFLTLLVTEMKNQDPTANTDPNAYINQLVQVNSLQQLIQVNQTLAGMGSVGGSATPSASGNVTTRAIAAASRLARSLDPEKAAAPQTAASGSAYL